MMRVLVACEYSGTVRDAFRARGCDAWSCDILPCEADPTFHIQGDVLDILTNGWDLIIAHPPCTYLSYAGNAYWNRPGRARKRAEALAFFLELYNAPAPRVAVENPVGWPNTVFRSPDQIIDPFCFGEPVRKRTCLWLRGLRPLEHREQPDLFGDATHIAPPAPIYVCKSGHAKHFTEASSGGPEGAHIRSKTFASIAHAMAEQWAELPTVDCCEHNRDLADECIECDREIETIASAARLDRNNKHAAKIA
jgi:hypothetical protein